MGKYSEGAPLWQTVGKACLVPPQTVLGIDVKLPASYLQMDGKHSVLKGRIERIHLYHNHKPEGMPFDKSGGKWGVHDQSKERHITP